MGNYKSATGELQNSGQLQNNTVNGAMSIAIDRVIIELMSLTILAFSWINNFILVLNNGGSFS